MRWRARPQDRQPDPPPLVTDDRAAIAVGTGVWAVLAVLALAARSRLDASGHGWWLRACVAGVVLGLIGLWHVHRRAQRLSRRGAQALRR